jgi:hypothetical protein
MSANKLAEKTTDDGLELASHSLFQKDFDKTYHLTKARIKQEGDKPWSSLEERLEVFEAFCTFPLGRFLLLNQGLDGYWMDYIVRDDHNLNSLPPLEQFLLTQCPMVLASRERLEIFQDVLQKQLFNGITMASIPSGVMRSVLTLDYSSLNRVRLIAVDLDFEALIHANSLAEKMGLGCVTEYRQTDAFELGMDRDLDIAISHALNFYESDKEKISVLYKNLYHSLKPGGLLVTSFLTPSPEESDKSPWNMKIIDTESLRLSKIIFGDIIHARWSHSILLEDFSEQLTIIGFENIHCIYDERKLMPTLVAQRPE